MPLTTKGETVLTQFKKEYGEKGESYFYAARNKGTISGVDSDEVRGGTPAAPMPPGILGGDSIRGAGILFATKDGQALFLKRGDGGDYPGLWCLPGGTAEDGETALDTAKRETIEEIGFLPKGKPTPHTRTLTPREIGADAVVDFATFLQEVDETFEPQINGEHVGWAWAPVNQPPQPLHPGVDIALRRLAMDELGVARAMAAGDLVSPQQYANITMFAMRLTGTGVAFRGAVKDAKGNIIRKAETVFRDKALYLTPDFLARCNGLPVIIDHPPDKPMMDAAEFHKRVVGTVFLAFIRDDEVWCICKIWNPAAAHLLSTEQLSTSPSVVFLDPSVNQKLHFDDGSVLLIEGKPSLLDHLAICEQGVWDKGGDPVGIQADDINGESSMTEAEMAADKAKKDAEEKARKDAEGESHLSKILAGIDSICGRMDATEKRMDAIEMADKARRDSEEAARKDAAKKDAEEEEATAKQLAADKAKKDAEAEEEKTRKDAEEKARKDAVSGAALLDRMAKLEAGVLMTDADFDALAKAQTRADAVFSMFGQSAIRPAAGERAGSYERRCAMQLKANSKAWKDVDVAALPDQAFTVALDQIYADSVIAARSPSSVPAGRLRPRPSRTAAGHTIIEYEGQSPLAWMQQFMPPQRFVTGHIKGLKDFPQRA